MKGNKKFLVEFKATKKLVIPAKDKAEAIEKATKRVGGFWQVANALDIFSNEVFENTTEQVNNG